MKACFRAVLGSAFEALVAEELEVEGFEARPVLRERHGILEHREMRCMCNTIYNLYYIICIVFLFTCTIYSDLAFGGAV